jgi:poly-gamma-glutamate synthesis protein (capsule biosynthesis protein)
VGGGRPIIGGIVAAAFVAGAVASAASIGGATVGEPARRAERHPRTFSVVASGDWLAEHLVLAAAAGDDARYDHVPLLAPIAPIVASADLAICHMETPIGGPGDVAGFRGRSPAGYTLIAAPYEVAADLRRVGFDRCSTASNHSFDLGSAGIDGTLAALDAAGLTHVGTARTATESQIQVFPVEGVAVAHLSYARNSNTGWPVEAWSVDRVVSADRVVDDVAAARSAGAEVVIVSIHVFVEMQPSPTPDDRALVTSILDRADVDLVVLHGPHVIQPMEFVNGTPVFWSLGNLVSGMGVPGRGRYSDHRALDGLLAAARFVEQRDGTFSVEVAPVLTCQMAGTRVVYPGIAARSWAQVDDADRVAIEACIARSGAVVVGLR